MHLTDPREAEGDAEIALPARPICQDIQCLESEQPFFEAMDSPLAGDLPVQKGDAEALKPTAMLVPRPEQSQRFWEHGLRVDHIADVPTPVINPGPTDAGAKPGCGCPAVLEDRAGPNGAALRNQADAKEEGLPDIASVADRNDTVALAEQAFLPLVSAPKAHPQEDARTVEDQASLPPKEAKRHVAFQQTAAGSAKGLTSDFGTDVADPPAGQTVARMGLAVPDQAQMLPSQGAAKTTGKGQVWPTSAMAPAEWPRVDVDGSTGFKTGIHFKGGSSAPQADKAQTTPPLVPASNLQSAPQSGPAPKAGSPLEQEFALTVAARHADPTTKEAIRFSADAGNGALVPAAHQQIRALSRPQSDVLFQLHETFPARDPGSGEGSSSDRALESDLAISKDPQINQSGGAGTGQAVQTPKEGSSGLSLPILTPAVPRDTVVAANPRRTGPSSPPATPNQDKAMDHAAAPASDSVADPLRNMGPLPEDLDVQAGQAPGTAYLPGPLSTSSGTTQTVSAGIAQQLSQVVVSVAQRTLDGPIDVTLRPEELGHLRFELTTTGDRLHVHLFVERPEALDLIRRNIDQLMADLRQSGFEQTSLSFGNWAQRNRHAGTQRGGPTEVAVGALARVELAELPLTHAQVVGAGRLDIRL